MIISIRWEYSISYNGEKKKKKKNNSQTTLKNISVNVPALSIK